MSASSGLSVRTVPSVAWSKSASFVRVVLVHLATMGLDEYFLLHVMQWGWIR